MANYMNDEVPGVFVPDLVLKRMEAADAAGNAQEEGVQITLELIEKIHGKQGVNGFHIMAVGWEEIVPRIIKEAALLPENQLDTRQ
jgi:methylenetetrahydrofolate reductase (NADPH)